MIYVQIDKDDQNRIIGRFLVRQSLPDMYKIDEALLDGYSTPCYDPDTHTVTEYRRPRADLEAEYMRRINADADAELAQLKAQYPDHEVMTWDRQEQQARAWLDNAEAHTPLLDALAAERGLDKAELVQRIISKADAWDAMAGAIIGRRQALEDALPDMTDEEIGAYLRGET